MSFGGGAPAPPPPIAPPTRSDEEIQSEARAERLRRSTAQGRTSTIKTGGQGDEGTTEAVKTLLGA